MVFMMAQKLDQAGQNIVDNYLARSMSADGLTPLVLMVLMV